ncbi:piggyBac transposable element-derived protein 3-like [Amphiura filiformis]|uniref:piggyBac transposable element-derived protein 3-like n=1 Tax=Amphiura filiformis TaxID=82378 RepID=UPI003B21FFFA
MPAPTAALCGRTGRRPTLEEVLDNLDNSDIDLSDSETESDEEKPYEPNNDDQDNSGDENDSNDDVGIDDESDKLGPSTSTATKQQQPEIKWRANRNKFEPNATWTGNFHLGDPLETPVKYFSKYFKPEIFQTFAEETNRYYFQQKGRNLRTTADEIRKFFGVSIIMANLHFPRIRMFWHRATRIDRIVDAMQVNRYFQLRKNVHINAAREPDTQNQNKFWKMQPVMDAVRNRCLELPREEYTAVDEQMIPFTGRVPAKQFIKNNPNPVGIKSFVICGSSGRALDFELFQGKGTGIPEETKHLGLGASVVLRLTESIPRQMNYKVCFDNYFTGMPLVRELKTKGIQVLGVDKVNRLKGCELKSDKDLKKEGHMGGVDKLDFLISLYRMKAKTKKWPVTVIFHFIDLALVNSWLEYRDIERANGSPRACILDLLGYRNEVADVLLRADLDAPPPDPRPVGRPRSSSPTPQAPDQAGPPHKRAKPAERPVQDVRYDGYRHFPACIKELGQRCKYEGCKSRSRVKCVKCEVFLCLSKDKNCFLAFHTK